VCNGDLINRLDFHAVSSKTQATMGQTLRIDPGNNVQVIIRFRSPERNHNGDRPVVQTVQLIMGTVTEKVAPGSPDYDKAFNESSKIIASFTSKHLKRKNGWTEISYKIPNLNKDSYFRIRGTNHLPGALFETDQSGNPLPDSLATNLNLDGAAEAWSDLWFYSNPIFIDVQ
jgi:hypothetical protein